MKTIRLSTAIEHFFIFERRSTNEKNTLFFLVAIMCFLFVACDNNGHEGEAKTPSGSSVMAGRNYKDVIEVFRNKGFTNIKTEPIEDLVLGWLTKDGEVEEVFVGGDVNYASDRWLPADTEVVIRYHTFPKEGNTDTSTNAANPSESTKPDDEILTIVNCPDLVTLLSLKNPGDPFVEEFARKYKGRMIAFDGNIAAMSKHGNYNTRYDILILAGDYDETSAIGPNFQFVDVNMLNLNLVGDYIPDYIGVGDNVHIVAKVGNYNEISELFQLDPVSTEIR